MGEHPDLDVPRIKQGVFFTSPPPLPRGPHNLAREDVLRSQRNRLMIACTELLAARGFSGFSIGDLATRARLSRMAFYECFDSKEQCVDAAYEHYVDALTQVIIVQTGDDDPDSAIEELIGSYFSTLQEDLVAARAFHVEIDAAGAPIRRRRRESLLRLARLIRAAQIRSADHDHTINAELPIEAYLGLVYAARQLVADRLDTAAQPDLVELTARFAPWARAGLRRPLPAYKEQKS